MPGFFGLGHPTHETTVGDLGQPADMNTNSLGSRRKSTRRFAVLTRSGALLLLPTLLSSYACSRASEVEEPQNVGGLGGAPGTDPEERGGEPPVFGGVMAARVDGSQVHLSWSSAYDESTPERRIVYRIYAGTGGRPVNVRDPIATTPPGANEAHLLDLPPGAYRFVVRAIDEEGNADDNKHSVEAFIDDKSPPAFDGVTGVVSTQASAALVAWKTASDDVTSDRELEYLVYVSPDRDELFEVEPLVTQPGALKQAVVVDTEATEVWVGVRARDQAGNVDDNERRTSTRSTETEPPRFAGLNRALADGTTVRLFWSPAIDDVTASPEMIYRVYYATSSGDYNFLAPNVLSQPGATQIAIPGLEPEQQYYFVVQAQDLAGNRDGNFVERMVQTGTADTTAPTFAGVTNAQVDGPTSATLSWEAASDDRTVPSRLRYRVFLSRESGAQDFDRPTLTTLAGRTSVVVTDLDPEENYHAVVRAMDETGQVDENEVEVSFETTAATADDQPPQLAGLLLIKSVPSRPDWLEVVWSGATDNESGPAKIRGRVCVARELLQCQNDSFDDAINQIGLFGATSVFLTGLDSRTSYWVGLRLEDENGNVMTESVVESKSTSTSFTHDVEPMLQGRCSGGGCHNYTYGNTVNVPAPGTSLYLVEPGNLHDSFLLRTLREPGDTSPPFSEATPADHSVARMPTDGSDYLTSEEEQILFDWIVQGAFND